MRVTAGTAKGHKLAAPKGLLTRPTADKIKQSVFNIISGNISNASFLDLYAGSGQIGIEALSRGADKCVFVELNDEAVNCIKKNIAHTKLSLKSQILKRDVRGALKSFDEYGEKFDIIFMDPPYNMAEEIHFLSKEIKRVNILTEGGFIIAEHNPDIDLKEVEHIRVFKEKIYGKTAAVSFWEPV